MLRRKEEYNCEYLDLNFAEGNGARKRPIEHVISKTIKTKFEDHEIRDVIINIQNNRDILENIFTYGFLEEIAKQKDIANKDWLRENLRTMAFGDVFLFYMLLLFYRFRRDPRRCIVFLDNLDQVEIDYISESFQRDFTNALITATSLAHIRSLFDGDVIPFTRQFRFVFCLRDPNGAMVIAHQDSRTGPSMKSIPFRLRFDAAFYRRVLDLRLDLMSLVMLNRDEEINAVRQLLEMYINDWYFEDACLPLFNFDYREVACALFELVRSYLNKERSLERFVSTTNDLNRYAGRATLMQGMISYLKKQGALEDYSKIPGNLDFENVGYCHHLRVVTNMIFNLSRIEGATFEIGYKRIINHCNLYDLLEALGGVCHHREILDVLCRAFLYHKRNWANLISIYNYVIDDVDAFDDLAIDIDRMLEIDKKERFTITESERESSREIVERLRRVTLKINPAGIAYLHHVLPNFEFYSSLVIEHNKSLFEYKAIDNVEYRYGKRRVVASEPIMIIDRVYWLVEHHVRWMNTFYQRVFASKDGLGIMPAAYELSDHSYKFIGNQLRREGIFHATRLIFHHIGYIDSYRLWVLKLESPYNSDNPVRFNKALIERIGRYVKLLETQVDHRSRPGAERMQECISVIASSDFRDFDTPIQWRPKHQRDEYGARWA